MAPSFCGDKVNSKRTLLALGWSIVNFLAFISFLAAISFALSTNNYAKNQQYYNDYNGQNEKEEKEMETSVTSRAMAFTALWTMVLSTLIGIYGTVVLGFVSPTGKYYWCCMPNVHRTTHMVLGAFIGSLLMYANLTLVCSVLFGEFKVRDYNDDGHEEEMVEQKMSTSSTAFSILCMFLTILYAGFAALIFTYSADLIRENEEDEREMALSPSDPINGQRNDEMSGYIGNKFTVRSPASDQGSYIRPISDNFGQV